MPTSFDQVIDLALVQINDYKLAKLYNQSIDKYNDWIDTYLISASYEFTNCFQSLSFSKEARAFDSDLTLTEQSILADLWVLKWWERIKNDAAQLGMKLQSGAFKNHSEASSLKEKSTEVDKIREKVYQKMQNEYPLENLSRLEFFGQSR